jgi:hypothetical protein
MDNRSRDTGREFVAILATITLFVIGVLSVTRPASAYLMLVRQGQESADLSQPGDRLGTTVATGDFDNDGYDDLACAAPFENENIGVGEEHGSVIVNYGSLRGITHVSADYLTVGAVPDDDVHYGWAMAVGDFDNDGFDDLAVGLPDLDGTQFTIAEAGEVWIHEGGAQGLPSTPSLTLTHNNAGDAIEVGDRFGYSLAAGDFNDDGFDDLAVGVIGEDGGSGAVSVFYGSASGISTTGAQTYRPIQLGSTPEPGGNFGWSLAAGPLYDTAHDDLAIGAPFRMAVGQATAGMVFVMKGAATGLTTAGSLIYDEQAIGFGAEPTNRFGYALAIGQISGEADTPQLVVGSPGYDGGTTDRGQAFVISDFTPPYAQIDVDHIVQGFGGVETGETGDFFGSALAVADFDQDGRDDLAVSAPFENLENNPITGVNTTDAGVVILYKGAFIFPGNSGNTILHARALNDTIQASDQLGTGLAFGRFDDSGRPNLAIGCPGKDDRNYRTGDMTANAGQVYIYASWRQLVSKPHRSSVALNCAGQIMFAQRPFDAIPPASTTKAMTVLLAVEAIQNQSIDSNYVYTVPEWVANSNKVSGSQAGLLEGQQIRFVDLIKLAVSVSAGDACYAIGDILTGGGHVWNGLEGTIPEFAAGMNTRADQLGMQQTNFTNPSGRPLVNHFTTAYDFALLARQAMTNSLYRYFVGTTVWADIPNWPVTPYGWMQTLKSLNPNVDGVKPGGNGLGLKTGLVHATNEDDRVSASIFGVPAVKYGSPVEDTLGVAAVQLLAFGASDCPPGFAAPQPPPPAPDPWGTLTDIATTIGPDQCVQTFLDDRALDDALIEVWPQVVPGSAAMLRLFTSRSSELYLQAGEQVLIAFEHGDAHAGFVIGNLYNSTANLEITLSEPAGTTNLALPGGAEHVIPADPSIADYFELQIRNTSSVGTAWLHLEELGYTSTEAVGGRAHATAILGRPYRLDDEVVRVCVGGLDPMPGNEVYLVVRPTSGIVGVDPLPTPPAVTSLANVRPNPFRDATTCSFTLSREGPVWLTVHDVAGRHVRELASGELRAAGPHTVHWDGTDNDRRLVPAGIYFLRMRTADGSRTEKAVRLE